MAAFDELDVLRWIAHVDPHRLIPCVRQRSEPAIKFRAHLLDDVRQWVIEIFIFAAAEAIPCHDHAAPEGLVVRIEVRKRPALLWSENAREYGIALFIEVFDDLFQSSDSRRTAALTAFGSAALIEVAVIIAFLLSQG